jgi:hypothetical protein
MSTEPEGSRKKWIPLYWLLAAVLGILVLAMIFPVFSRSRESARLGRGYVPGVGITDKAEHLAGEQAAAPRTGRFGGRGQIGAAGGGGALATTADESMPGGDFDIRLAFQAPATPMLIRTGSLRLRVEDVPHAHEEVARIAREANGYLASTSLTSEHGPPRANMTIRVPSVNLDDVIRQIAALGRVLKREISTQEVTEEYVDLTSRRRNLEREEERLLELLQRAGKISDLLQVEQYLGNVRGQIERIAGRMRYLENRVAFSTLNVNLEGPEPAPSVGGPAWAATDVYRQALRSLRGTGRAFAEIGIWLGVYAAVWVPIVLILIWLLRRALPRPESEAAAGK